MEFETSELFSSFEASLEAGRVAMRPGSHRFVPVLPSSIGFQSNEMLVSHSNQSRVHLSSPIPIRQAQSSNEIHGVFNPQYSNVHDGSNSMQPSSNLNALQAKAPMPTTRAGMVVPVEKRGPSPQDSLRSSSSASGGNGEVLSHSQNNSASDEAEDQIVIDERKQRRMLSNRESARRSRLRKQQHLDELRAQVAHLRAENGQILNKFHVASQHYTHITEENCILKSQAMELTHKLQKLHHTMNAHSYSGFRVLGVENGHCNAATLGLESAHLAQSLTSSDLLF